MQLIYQQQKGLGVFFGQRLFAIANSIAKFENTSTGIHSPFRKNKNEILFLTFVFPFLSNQISSIALLNSETNVPCSVERGLNAFAKNINPCQPARTAQADVG